MIDLGHRGTELLTRAAWALIEDGSFRLLLRLPASGKWRWITSTAI